MLFGVKKKDGVSNVIASIMILGIMTSLMGMVFTTYIPAMAESIQYEHQRSITQDLVVFKNTLDTLVVRNDLEVSMSTSMVLGNEGGPLMSVGHNSGTLSLYPENNPSEIVDIDVPISIYSRGRGTVIFETSYDRIRNKVLHLEHDGIIIDQEGKAVMKVEPNTFLRKTGSTIKFSYTSMSYVGEAVSITGTRIVSVSSTLISTQRNTYYQTANNDLDDVELNFTTSFPSIWALYFTELAESGGLDAVDFDVKSGSDWCSIEVYDVSQLTTVSAVIEVGFKE
jgi:hypothetical protein